LIFSFHFLNEIFIFLQATAVCTKTPHNTVKSFYINKRAQRALERSPESEDL